MSTIATLKSWSNAEVLTHTDLNSNFSAIRTPINTYGMFTDVNRTVTANLIFNPGAGVGITVSAGGLTVSAGKVTTAASLNGTAGLNLPHGTAPGTPADGDVWTTTGGLFVRVNGATQTAVSGTGTNGKTARFTGTATVADGSLSDDGTYVTHAAQPRCYVRQSASTTSVNAAGNATVAFDETDIVDVGTMHDPVTNNTRVTVPASAGGLYLVFGQFIFSGSATNGQVKLELLKDGSTLHGNGIPQVYAASDVYTLTTTRPVVLVAGEYIGLKVTNDGSQTISGRGELSVVRLW